MPRIDTFEDLECYKAAREFRIVVADWAKHLPSEEKYRLIDQTIRAVRSITANIAEGFGRKHPQANLQFCRQARGSLMEVLEHLNTAVDERLILDEPYNDLRGQWHKVRTILSGYIKYLESLTTKDRRFIERS
ncbi:MAG: four helix bundle protein [Planctomycetales bacterium]|nr:four helix bundle protein [Planctomycetales bacterium]